MMSSQHVCDGDLHSIDSQSVDCPLPLHSECGSGAYTEEHQAVGLWPLWWCCHPCTVPVPMGRTFSHAPDSFAVEANRRACALVLGAISSRDSARADALGSSQALCECCSTSSGGARSWPRDHRTKASHTLGICSLWRRAWMTWWTRSKEAAVEAK